MSVLEGEITRGWQRVITAYGDVENGVYAQEQTPEIPGNPSSINVSDGIPHLQALIDASDKKEILEQEIKALFSRGYWNGYYTGFEQARSVEGTSDNRVEEGSDP